MMRKTPTKTNTTVKRDQWSLYVRVDGAVFRPVLTRHSYPMFQPMYQHQSSGRADPHAYKPDPSMFKEGEAVHARHMNQTPYARVQTLDGRQGFWASHGSYYGQRADGRFGVLPSETCWHENKGHKI